VAAADVALVREGYEYFRRTGELPLHLLDADIVWKVDGLPEGQDVRGHDGVALLFSSLHEMFEGYYAEPEAYEDLGAGLVLAVVRQHGKAQESGVELGTLGVSFQVWEVRGGKFVRHEAYFDREKALAAARKNPY
jgi:ketosteroid isomerase-like protein